MKSVLDLVSKLEKEVNKLRPKTKEEKLSYLKTSFDSLRGIEDDQKLLDAYCLLKEFYKTSGGRTYDS